MANVIGTSGGDLLGGTGYNDTIQGGAGNDSLEGGAGTDRLAGDAGADVLNGGDGDDVLYAGAQSPTFSAPVSSWSSGTAPLMDTDFEVDVLSGGPGDDHFLAGYGDHVDGGTQQTGDVLYITFQSAPAGINADFRALAGGGTITLAGGVISGIEQVGWLIGSEYADLLAPIAATSPPPVYALGGDDTVIGAYYTGFVFGGAGNDLIDKSGSGVGYETYGESGNDTLIGGYAGDILDGGDGDDRMLGGHYSDRMLAGDGNDWVEGGSWDDTLLGGGGDDTLLGGSNADTLWGGAGHDDMRGDGDVSGYWNEPVVADWAAPDDRLFGGAGNDTLEGGAGNDTLEGGSGVDTARFTGALSGYSITYERSQQTFVVTDDTGSRDGTDRIFGVEFLQFADTLMAATDLAVGQSVVSGGTDLRPGSAYADSLEGLAGGDMLGGGASEDTLDGGDGADILRGGDGNDSLLGGAGNDTLDGGAGDDRLVPGAGAADVVEGGEGNDTVVFAEVRGAYTVGYDSATLVVHAASAPPWDGNVRITGAEMLQFANGGFAASSFGLLSTAASDGGDLLRGGTGAQALSAGKGADTLMGGGGNDTLEGGEGNDVAWFAGNLADYVIASVGANTLRITHTGAAALGSVLVSGIEWLAFADTVVASSTAVPLAGSSGPDILAGGGRIQSGEGADSVTGGGANDTLEAGAGNDTLAGGAGEDRLHGGAGNDFLCSDTTGAVEWAKYFPFREAPGPIDTGASPDFLDGGYGDDLLFAGFGDSVDGGVGDMDVLLASYAGAPHGVHADFRPLALGERRMVTIEGADIIDIDAVGWLEGSRFGDFLAPIAKNGIGDNVLIARSMVYGRDGDDTIIGGNFTALMDGGAGNDLLDASETGDGLPDLVGGAGNDTLIGGQRFNDMRGDEGDDVLIGQDFPSDSLQGGQGHDVLDGGSASDWLLGDAGDDMLYGAGDNDELKGGDGNDLLSGDQSLYPVWNSLSSDSNTDFIDGGAGADTLWGDLGDDYVNGGTGLDTAFFAGSRNGYVIERDPATTRLQVTDTNASRDGIDFLWGVEVLSFADRDWLVESLVNSENDSFTGTPHDEYIMGYAGNDTLNSYLGDDTLDGGSGNDSLVGDTWGFSSEELYGGGGDDTLAAGHGDDVLDGGDGQDVAIFKNARADYTVVVEDETLHVSRIGDSGFAAVRDVELLKFADVHVALEIGADMASTLRLINACLGAPAIGNAGYVGTGLRLFSTGWSEQAVADYAAQVAWGSASHERFVAGLFLNIVHTPPSVADLAFYSGWLNDGTVTRGQLLLMAAHTNENVSGIDFTGLAQVGVAFVPF